MASNLIIFDLDGTLAYTIDDITTAVNGMLTRLGYKNRTKTEVLKFINNGARELIRRALPKNVQDSELIIDTALALYEEEYAICYCEKTVPYDGIIEMLRALKKKGYKLAVLSNKQDAYVKKIVDLLFEDGFISYAQGQRQDLPKKPDPTAPRMIAELFAVDTDDCAFIGDSEVDVLTAKNADMTAIGCSWGYRPAESLTDADVIANDPRELDEIFE